MDLAKTEELRALLKEHKVGNASSNPAVNLNEALYGLVHDIVHAQPIIRLRTCSALTGPAGPAGAASRDAEAQVACCGRRWRQAQLQPPGAARGHAGLPAEQPAGPRRLRRRVQGRRVGHQGGGQGVCVWGGGAWHASTEETHQAPLMAPCARHAGPCGGRHGRHQRRRLPR
jgi:hypothetical protein